MKTKLNREQVIKLLLESDGEEFNLPLQRRFQDLLLTHLEERADYYAHLDTPKLYKEYRYRYFRSSDREAFFDDPIVDKLTKPK